MKYFHKISRYSGYYLPLSRLQGLICISKGRLLIPAKLFIVNHALYHFLNAVSTDQVNIDDTCACIDSIERKLIHYLQQRMLCVVIMSIGIFPCLSLD